MLSISTSNKSIDVEFTLNIALVSEFRLENFIQTVGEDESWQNFDSGIKEAGFQVFPEYQRGNGLNKFRFHSGFFGELETEFTDKFLVGFAERFEEYSDFGNNFSWKLSIRYSVTDNVIFRGAYSTGFRAPLLPQKYFSSFTLQSINLDDGTIMELISLI